MRDFGLNDDAGDARLPRWRFTRWLIEPGADVSPPVRLALVDSLYGSIPIFIGAVVNTVTVSSVVAFAIPSRLFIAWATIEILLSIVRLPVLIACRRAAREGTRGPTDLYICLAVVWAVSVGFGAFISIWSGNWVVAALACLSTAAMVGGICFRNFAAPRLVCVMIFTSFGPIAIAGVTSGEPLMLLTGLQIPLYLYAMTVAAYRMNAMMVRTMHAELANAHRASHDPLTDLLNRTGFADTFAALPAKVPVACFYIDLDGFKRVNDTLGHQAGDRLLTMVAQRLRQTARAGSILARTGGDEFIVITACGDRNEAASIGDVLAAAVASQPYIVDAQGVFVGASVGAALRAGHDLDELVALADDALYRAKANDGSACVVAGVDDEQDSAEALCA